MKTLPCPLEDPRDVIAEIDGFQLIFQRTPYTPAGLLAVPTEHRSTLDENDLKNLLRLTRVLSDRFFWWSGPRSGGTQSHAHVQAHLRTALGGVLPIEHSARKQLLRIHGVVISRIEGYPLPGLSVAIREEQDVDLAVHIACVCISELHGPYNLLVPTPTEILVIGRSKEIPSGWSKKFGGAEIAGVLIFNQAPQDLTYDVIQAALSDVGLPQVQQESWEARIVQCLSRPGGVRRLTDLHIRLAILDIEGVLTPAGADGPWDWSYLGALRCLLEGMPLVVVLCSGRQVPYGEALSYHLNLLYPLKEDLANELGAYYGRTLKGWPSIFENGAFYFDPVARLAFENPRITKEQHDALREICQAVEELRKDGAALETGKKICISLNPPFVAGGKERIPIADFSALVSAKLSTYEAQGFIDIAHSASAVDITPKGISKAIAVQDLLAAAGLLPEQVLGVDDSRGGADWLRVVGLRATPANGSPELDDLVHYRSPHREVRGTLDILQKLTWCRAQFFQS